jgi:6-phosphogluconolactonase
MILTEFSSREAASAAATTFLVEHLESRLVHQSRAALMVSGGSSPVACLRQLSERAIDWSRVDVSLTDERLVAVTHEASNEKMVRETLLMNVASGANFCELSAANADLIVSTQPVCLVGMGEDGHFASIFPDSSELDDLLDLDAAPAVVNITTDSSPYPRRTANLAMLLRSSVILLLVYGEKKRAVLEASSERLSDLPIARLIQQTRVPITIYWAP